MLAFASNVLNQYNVRFMVILQQHFTTASVGNVFVQQVSAARKAAFVCV